MFPPDENSPRVSLRVFLQVWKEKLYFHKCSNVFPAAISSPTHTALLSFLFLLCVSWTVYPETPWFSSLPDEALATSFSLINNKMWNWKTTENWWINSSATSELIKDNIQGKILLFMTHILCWGGVVCEQLGQELSRWFCDWTFPDTTAEFRPLMPPAGEKITFFGGVGGCI